MKRITSFDDPDVGEGTILNEVVREYSPFNLLTDDWQEHDGAVTGYSPKVSYGYSDPEYDEVHRRTSMRYPANEEVVFDYLGEISNALNRISGIYLPGFSDTVASYRYAGTGRNTRVEYPSAGVALDFMLPDGDSDSGTPITGYDRLIRVRPTAAHPSGYGCASVQNTYMPSVFFGRTTNMPWVDGYGYATKAHIQYGYDRASRRNWRRDVLAAAYDAEQDRAYQYDALGQVIASARGILNIGHLNIGGIPEPNETWRFDSIGNWLNHTEDISGTTVTDQNRTHNTSNEIVTIDGSSKDVAYDWQTLRSLEWKGGDPCD